MDQTDKKVEMLLEKMLASDFSNLQKDNPQLTLLDSSLRLK